jgi:hypothetical protein
MTLFYGASAELYKQTLRTKMLTRVKLQYKTEVKFIVPYTL